MSFRQTNMQQSELMDKQQTSEQVPAYLDAEIRRNPFRSISILPQKTDAASMATFSLVWNAFSFPIAAMVMLDHAGEGAWHWLILVFPALGSWLMWIAARTAYRRWRIGKPVLQLAQFPATGMQGFAMRLQFSPTLGLRSKLAVSHFPVKMEVACIYEDRRGEDINTTTLRTLTLPEVNALRGMEHLDFLVDLPEDLPAAGLQGRDDLEVVWKLSVHVLHDTLDYLLPVQQGSGKKVNRDKVEEMMLRLAFPYRQPGAPLPVASKSAHWRLVVGFFLFPAIAFGLFFMISNLHNASGLQADNEPESLEMLQTRIANGADINARDAAGRSLLIQACDENNLTKVRYLLAHGANANLVTPLDASSNGERSALFAAIHHDAIDVVQALAEAGADLSRPSNQVWTPMHYAASTGALKSLRYLHERGLPVDQAFQGQRGLTPLMVAVKYNQLHVMHYLLEAGADRSKKDLYGEDACGYARFFKQAQAATALGCQ